MIPNPNTAPFTTYDTTQKSGLKELDEANKQLNSDHEMISAVYYSNWSPYSPRNFYPHDIDFSRISHVYYAFFLINEKTGLLKSSDEYADYQLNFVKKLYHEFPNIPLLKEPKEHSLIDKTKATGMLGELFYLKTSKFLNSVSQNKSSNISNFKVCMSVGGWSNKEAFHAIVKEDKKLNAFVDSCVETMFKNGFDGIDIDWEFPEDDGFEPKKYLEMVQKIRKKLDELELDLNSADFGTEKVHFQLSLAIPCAKSQLEYAPLQEIDKYVDYYNLMAYDLAGEWSGKTNYHSNLFPASSIGSINKKQHLSALQKVVHHFKNKNHDTNESLNIDETVRFMLDNVKLPSRKIILGMPLYGRGFTNVKFEKDWSEKPSLVNRDYKGVGGKSPDEPGMWLYNQLPDGKEYFDKTAISAYSFNSKTNTFVGYDNRESMRYKALYVLINKLGGAFWWEACGENKKIPLIKEFHDNLNVSWAKTDRCVWKMPKVRSYYLKKFGNETAMLNSIFSCQ
ncbi:hypothetical protein ACO0QE_004568 [Hanseniaspora vineae]